MGARRISTCPAQLASPRSVTWLQRCGSRGGTGPARRRLAGCQGCAGSAYGSRPSLRGGKDEAADMAQQQIHRLVARCMTMSPEGAKRQSRHSKRRMVLLACSVPPTSPQHNGTPRCYTRVWGRGRYGTPRANILRSNRRPRPARQGAPYADRSVPHDPFSNRVPPNPRTTPRRCRLGRGPLRGLTQEDRSRPA